MAIDGDNGTSTVGGGNTGYNWSGYAEWLAKTKNSTKTCNLIVNYYANGYNGSAAENPPPSSVRSYTGQSVDVRLVVEVASGDTMSNPGYVFVGWATSNNTPTVTYNPGDTISNSWAADYRGNSVTNLYAVWTNQNVITYNPDDNSIEKSAIYQVKQSGQSATLKGATFTRTGYTQTGWATTAGGPKVYNLGGTYSSNNPLSLYPVWQANTYTITYVANEGTGTMADQTVTYDSTFTPRACSFIREGYSFSSWNESQDGKGIRWKIQEYTVDRAENITLYAIWKGNEYTVYYDDNYSRYSDEITGDIVTFESEYAQPLKKVEVSLSPIQSLNGYSHPWPAGGGKNVADVHCDPFVSAGVTISAENNIVTINGTKSGGAYKTIPFNLTAGTYYVKAFVVGGTVSQGHPDLYIFDGTNNIAGSFYNSEKSFTIDTDSQLFVRMGLWDDNVTYTNYKLGVVISKTSGISAFSPYSNICPISGRTGLSVYDDPKYGGTIVFNQKFPTKTLSYVGTNYTITSNNDGKFTVNATATASQSTSVNHTAIGANAFTAGHVYAWIGNSDKIKVNLKAYSKNTDTIFKATTASYNNIVFLFDNLTAGTYEVFPQLFDLTEMFGQEKAEEVLSAEQSSTGSGVAWFRNLFPKDYYPYDNSYTETCVSAVNGDPYTKVSVDWSTQAGTVYNGTVNPVTGQLTVTHGFITLVGGNEATYSNNGHTNNATRCLVTISGKANGVNNMTSNQFVYNNSDDYYGIMLGRAANNKVEFYLPPSVSTDVADQKAWFSDNPTEVCFELATPITYQLTPQEIEALVGTNNVWSDGGPITIVYALDEVPQNMPPSTAIFGDTFYTRRNQLSRFGLTFKGWNTVPDGSGEAWLPSGVSMGTYKRTEDAVWNVSHNVTLYAQWDPNVYPFGTVFFNGRNAQDLGIIVEELPSYYYAERAFNHKQVNGKNGDVILDTGRYENVKKVYKVACYDPSRNFYESAVALSTFLHSAGSDYIRLEDSYEPSSYRMAIYEETNEIENLLGKAGRCEITFNCMPQRFLLSGDEEITIPSSGYSIYNPTAFDAKPMIRIQGTGTVTINGRSVQITENDNDMLVDCENQNAKDLSGTDMNYFIYCDEFPILKPGFNTISYTETIDAVKITPRWWIL